jgi:hypothetical protein
MAIKIHCVPAKLKTSILVKKTKPETTAATIESQISQSPALYFPINHTSLPCPVPFLKII